jgi:putative SOS response-associated peptidase YedK
MTWRDAFRNRRCLIPAAAFYEWVEVGGKAEPLRFERVDGEMLWIAGIWGEGQNGPCFSMITTEPNALVQRVHDRMPAVLRDDKIEPFLDQELYEFGPSGVSLEHHPATNFLRSETKPPPPPDNQGLLF